MSRGIQAPLMERLLNKVIINQQTDCWEFQGGKNNIGYGMIRDGDKMRTAHRVSYEQHKNVKIPKYKCVCHSCDNPICVNPNHLWLGSIKDNIRDMINKGRAKLGRNKGHKMPIGTCVHCGITKPVNILGKFHNDKCKHKPFDINTITHN